MFIPWGLFHGETATPNPKRVLQGVPALSVPTQMHPGSQQSAAQRGMSGHGGHTVTNHSSKQGLARAGGCRNASNAGAEYCLASRNGCHDGKCIRHGKCRRSDAIDTTVRPRGRRGHTEIHWRTQPWSTSILITLAFGIATGWLEVCRQWTNTVKRLRSTPVRKPAKWIAGRRWPVKRRRRHGISKRHQRHALARSALAWMLVCACSPLCPTLVCWQVSYLGQRVGEALLPGPGLYTKHIPCPLCASWLSSRRALYAHKRRFHPEPWEAARRQTCPTLATLADWDSEFESEPEEVPEDDMCHILDRDAVLRNKNIVDSLDSLTHDVWQQAGSQQFNLTSATVTSMATRLEHLFSHAWGSDCSTGGSTHQMVTGILWGAAKRKGLVSGLGTTTA